MQVTKQRLLSLAALVRLDLAAGTDAAATEKYIDELVAYMNNAAAFIDTITRVDATATEPMYSPIELTAPLREDVAAPTANPDAILANAPEKHGTFFCVPPVIEG